MIRLHKIKGPSRRSAEARSIERCRRSSAIRPRCAREMPRGDEIVLTVTAGPTPIITVSELGQASRFANERAVARAVVWRARHTASSKRFASSTVASPVASKPSTYTRTSFASARQDRTGSGVPRAHSGGRQCRGAQHQRSTPVSKRPRRSRSRSPPPSYPAAHDRRDDRAHRRDVKRTTRAPSRSTMSGAGVRASDAAQPGVGPSTVAAS